MAITEDESSRIFLPNAGHSVYYMKKKGIRLDYRQAMPEDCALIFLHHATGSSWDWKHQLTFFSSQGYHCIAYDRLGFGRSIEQDNNKMKNDQYHRTYMHTYPLDHYERSIQELFDFIQALKLRKVILISHSDGATLAMLAASGQHSFFSKKDRFRVADSDLNILKSRIVAIVIESPHIYFEQSILDGMNIFQDMIEKSNYFKRSMAKEHLNEENAQKVLDKWNRLWMLTPEYRKWDDRPVLEHIKCPALVIHGAKDIYFSVDHTLLIVNALKKHCPYQPEFVLFPNSGHTIHRENINEYNALVLNFIRKHESKLFENNMNSRL